MLYCWVDSVSCSCPLTGEPAGGVSTPVTQGEKHEILIKTVFNEVLVSFTNFIYLVKIALLLSFLAVCGIFFSHRLAKNVVTGQTVD